LPGLLAVRPIGSRCGHGHDLEARLTVLAGQGAEVRAASLAKGSRFPVTAHGTDHWDVGARPT